MKKHDNVNITYKLDEILSKLKGDMSDFYLCADKIANWCNNITQVRFAYADAVKLAPSIYKNLEKLANIASKLQDDSDKYYFREYFALLETMEDSIKYYNSSIKELRYELFLKEVFGNVNKSKIKKLKLNYNYMNEISDKDGKQNSNVLSDTLNAVVASLTPKRKQILIEMFFHKR